MVALLTSDTCPPTSHTAQLTRAETPSVGPNDVQFETFRLNVPGSELDSSRSIAPTASSRSELPFGLGGRSYFIAALLAAAFVLLLVARFAQWQSNAALEGSGSGDSASYVEESSAMHLGAPSGVQAEHTLVVQPGDTLWQIAIELAPEKDPRPMVDLLVEANGSSIYAGQEIVVPFDLATLRSDLAKR